MAIVDEFVMDAEVVARASKELSEAEQNRLKRGLSIEWFKYPRANIEVFYDSCAVIYRIEGQIYVVPRRDVMASFPPMLLEPAAPKQWLCGDWQQGARSGG